MTRDIPYNGNLPSDVRQSEIDGPAALDSALTERDWLALADRFWRHFVGVNGYDVLAEIDDGATAERIGRTVIEAWRKFGKGE